MTIKLKLGVLALAFAMLAGVGCKKSVKGEESRWTSANNKVNELAVLYPGFKAALDARRAQAKTVYDAAQGISEEKEQIKKLSEANNLLSGGFVDELSKLDEQLKGFRGQLIEATGAKVEGADMRKNQAAIDEAKRTLDGIDTLIKKGARDAATADIVMGQVAKELTVVKNHIALAMPAPTEATPAANAADPGAAAAAPVKAEPVSWTCEYCQHSNEPGAETCSQCGAAHAH